MITKSMTFVVAIMASAFAAAIPAAEYPSRNIEVVVPFGAGGGTDAMVRTLQQALEKRVPRAVAVINVPGAAGVLGSRKVRDARPDGHTLLVTHQTLLTAAAQGTAEYGPEAFEPVAQTTTSHVVVAVSAKSPHQTLGDLLDAAKQRPNEIRVETNIGAVAHYAWLMLSDAADGLQFRFVQAGGGAQRLAQLVGGHADASVFATNEAKPYHESGDLRVLAVLASERHPDFPDVPTAAEAGYDVEFSYDFWWFAPKGTPAEHVSYLADQLEAVLSDESMQKTLRDRFLAPTFLRGEALSAKIDEEYQQLRALAEQHGLVRK